MNRLVLLFSLLALIAAAINCASMVVKGCEIGELRWSEQITPPLMAIVAVIYWRDKQ